MVLGNRQTKKSKTQNHDISEPEERPEVISFIRDGPVVTEVKGVPCETASRWDPVLCVSVPWPTRGVIPLRWTPAP